MGWSPLETLSGFVTQQSSSGTGQSGGSCLMGAMAPQAQLLPENGAFCNCRTNHNTPFLCWVDP